MASARWKGDFTRLNRLRQQFGTLFFTLQSITPTISTPMPATSNKPSINDFNQTTCRQTIPLDQGNSASRRNSDLIELQKRSSWNISWSSLHYFAQLVRKLLHAISLFTQSTMDRWKCWSENCQFFKGHMKRRDSKQTPTGFSESCFSGITACSDVMFSNYRFARCMSLTQNSSSIVEACLFCLAYTLNTGNFTL